MASLTLDEVSLSYPVLGAQPTPPAVPSHSGAAEPEAARGLTGAASLTRDGGGAQVHALQSVCVDLKSGDRLGLIGRNGSGKSTLLRVMAGIYQPTSGTVRVEGRVAPLFAVGLGVKREASGRRNIILRGLMNGLTYEEAAEMIPEIAAFSGLGEFIDMPVRTYSSGMAMRLAFSMATAFSPEILLLDEWIGAGDEDFQKKAAKRMNTLVEGAGITVVASHKKPLLRRVCSTGLWLDRGIPRAYGPIDDVLEEMESAEAAIKTMPR